MIIQFNQILYHWLGIMALSSARIIPIFMLLPFLNNNIVSHAIRLPVAMLVGMAMWPENSTITFTLYSIDYFSLIVKESTIGLLLGCLLSIPFWVLHAVGCIIDNQRGATISSSIDPISGVDTSELANFFNLFCAVIFLESGGLVAALGVMRESYIIFNPLTFDVPKFEPILVFINEIMSQSIRLASPLIALFLMTEATLGLLSRFAPQMNVFSLALTVKSFLGFLILIIYLPSLLPESVKTLSFTLEKLILREI
ncbi:type III secretion system export apparatus subunit SctT [Rouxiella silvae]|uniref:type III secretion system export apparatus subunit SctT n=1 Tax=Rouxiella silvae TaxID=1646373 RepID=UPI0006F488A2|nr:type III secretion apparatus SpaR [Serratia sp. Leaf50]